MDIAAWLRELGLERYEEAFRDNDVDAKVLPHLTAEDLKDIGINSVGHRRSLLAAIEALRPETAIQEPEEPSATASPVAARSREAERRQLTVMFVDLVGSTELAARLDPEDMGHVIRAYQSRCAEAVARWGGHVAKYMGDGVLAYFGWPQAHEDDAERAVRAGLAVVEALPGLAVPTSEPLAARIGIATGLVMVGEVIGAGAAQEQAVVGKTPNLAARLQALAAPGSVVIDPRCQQLVGGLFEYADLGTQDLKGFAEPLRAWRVLGESRAESRFEALHGQQLTALVGREHEIGLLADRWERAKEGEGQVVLLSGEPGIGKSRIVRALRERLAAEPHMPLSHYCSPHHTSSALYPVIDLLERAAGFSRDDQAAARVDKLEALLARGTEALGEAVPLVAALLGIETGERYPMPALSPQRQKQRTLEVLIEQVGGLAARQPVLAVYEDMHWVDPTTLEALDLLIERVQHLPVLMLITFRPEFSPPWTGHAHVTQLSLSRLTRRHGQALVAAVTRGKALPDEMLDQILAKTDGVPLFVEELTKTVLESGLLRETADAFVLDGPLPPLAIPATLQDSLMARLDRLAPVKEVAQSGAVIGREFSHDLLAAVSPLSEAGLGAALDQLLQSELIFRRGTPPEATYSFKHSLVQDAAYQSLLRAKRQQLHGRIAAVLEEQFPEVVDQQPEVLAHHCTEAGMVGEAVEYWQKAGARAAERFAYAEASNHFRKAVQLLGESPASAARDRQELRLWLALGPALMSSSSWSAPDVGEAYVRAREVAQRVGEPVRQFTATWGLCVHLWQSGKPEAAQDLVRDLITLAEAQADTDMLLQAHHAAWMTDGLLGAAASCLKHADQGIALYRAERHHSQTPHYGGHDAGVCAYYHKAGALWQLGYPEGALRSAQDAAALAKQLGHPLSLVYALFHVAAVHWLRRESESAAAYASDVIAACRQHDLGHYLGAAEAIVGWASAMAREAAGIVEIEQGLADLDVAGPAMRKADCLLMLADACCSLSRFEQASAALERARAFFGETGLRRLEAEVARLEGRLLLTKREGGPDRAERCFLEALDVARRQESRSLELRAATSLARLWAEQGRRAEAQNLLAPVYSWFTEGFDTADLKDARALLDELA
jgi:class 3 adenylate cyclase/predicted ATPase